MGSRGPIGKSGHLKLVGGKKSDSSTKTPAKSSRGRPPVPSWVPPEGRRFVRKIMPLLEADGTLDPRDAGSLAAMGSVYAILAMAMKKLEEDGITVGDPEHPTEDEEGGEKKPAIRKHPLISVVMAANEKLNAWSKEFGLSVAARKRLGIEPPKGASKLDKFVSGKKY